MKPAKATPSAKGRTTAKVTPAPQGSKKPKATPSARKLAVPKPAPARKPKPAKASALDDSAPQDSTTAPTAISADAVAVRAYQNYLQRGSADGDPTDDWLRAEAELAAERRLARP